MTNNIPPNPPRSDQPGTPQDNPAGYDHLPPADTAHGLVIHASSPHGDANDFPVLKAFQDYLETERQQARKRLATLTFFFVALMTLVVAGFITAFVFTFGNMSKREDRIMDEAMQQRKDALPSAPVLANMTAQQVTKEFQSVAQNLQNHLGSQIALVGSAATNLNGKVDAQNIEMAKLRDALAALQKENASMLTNLPKLAAEAARKAMPPAPVLPPPVVAPPVRPVSSTVSPATTTAGTPAAAAGKSPKGYDETVVQIRSHDGENTIPWRTFVPQ